MKKIIIPIIIAAALGVGGGITAVMMNKPVSADKDRSIPEVKTGNYYLNGDKNSGVWFEVTPDYLSLKGDDVDGYLRSVIIKEYEEDEVLQNATLTDDTLQTMLEEYRVLFCGEKIYVVSYMGLESMPYVINVSRDNTATTSEELLKSNAGFPYNGKDTIMLKTMGDFILVD